MSRAPRAITTSFLVLLLFVAAGVAQQSKPSAHVSAATWVREGADALQKEDLAHAKALFKRALASDPRNVEAHTFLGAIADREGALQEAETHFKAAAAQAPDSPEARNNYGAILLRMDRRTEAATQFERSLRLKPDQPAALLNLANIRFSSTDPVQLNSARELLQKADALAPDAEVERALVIADCRMNDAPRAAQDYARYKETTSSNASTEDPQKRRDLGASLLAAGLYKEAAAELQPASSEALNDASTVALLAKAQRAAGDQVAAGKALESALSRGIKSGDIYSELAKVYEATGHPENAIPAMRLAIESDPENIDYRFHYGVLLTDAKAPQGAVMRLQEALVKFPNSAKLWFALGFAQLEDHKDADAKKSLLHAASLDPNYAPAQVFLGVSESQLGHYKEAQARYERGVELAPKTAVLHEMIAESMQKQDPPNLQGAELELKRCIQQDPNFAPAHLELGKIYATHNQIEAAAAEFEASTKLDPSLTEAHYQLGRMYHRLKRKDEAEREFERFKQLTDQDKNQQAKERQDLVHNLANTLF